jgi:hypothetical protein
MPGKQVCVVLAGITLVCGCAQLAEEPAEASAKRPVAGDSLPTGCAGTPREPRGGVDFFQILWYPLTPGNPNPNRNGRLNAAVDQFMASPRRDRLRFTIAYVNHAPFEIRDPIAPRPWGVLRINSLSVSRRGEASRNFRQPIP